MYSQTLIETPTLIDDIFIAGMSNIELEVLRHSTSFEKTKTKPEILYSSSQTQTLKNSIDFAFPNGIDVSLFQEKSKIYAIVLTNEKGVRTYLYILLLYDKVKLNEDDLKVEISKTSITSTSSLSKSFYVPVAICLLSHVMNIDFFRSFLVEINNIIQTVEKFRREFIFKLFEKNFSTVFSTILIKANSFAEVTCSLGSYI